MTTLLKMCDVVCEKEPHPVHPNGIGGKDVYVQMYLQIDVLMYMQVVPAWTRVRLSITGRCLG